MHLSQIPRPVSRELHDYSISTIVKLPISPTRNYYLAHLQSFFGEHSFGVIITTDGDTESAIYSFNRQTWKMATL